MKEPCRVCTSFIKSLKEFPTVWKRPAYAAYDHLCKIKNPKRSYKPQFRHHWSLDCHEAPEKKQACCLGNRKGAEDPSESRTTPCQKLQLGLLVASCKWGAAFAKPYLKMVNNEVTFWWGALQTKGKHIYDEILKIFCILTKFFSMYVPQNVSLKPKAYYKHFGRVWTEQTSNLFSKPCQVSRKELHRVVLAAAASAFEAPNLTELLLSQMHRFPRQ